MRDARFVHSAIIRFSGNGIDASPSSSIDHPAALDGVPGGRPAPQRGEVGGGGEADAQQVLPPGAGAGLQAPRAVEAALGHPAVQGPGAPAGAPLTGPGADQQQPCEQQRGKKEQDGRKGERNDGSWVRWYSLAIMEPAGDCAQSRTQKETA